MYEDNYGRIVSPCFQWGHTCTVTYSLHICHTLIGRAEQQAVRVPKYKRISDVVNGTLGVVVINNDESLIDKYFTNVSSQDDNIVGWYDIESNEIEFYD